MKLTVPNGTWIVDPTHSEVSFTVKHLMISKVKGKFKEFSGQANVSGDEGSQSASISFEIEAASIDTNETNRDNHLRSADFFDAENHPTISFSSTAVEPTGKGNEVLIAGDLTIRGVTKRETFRGEIGGVAVDPYGNTKASIEVEAKINRSDYGLTWNTALEAGGVLVSEQVSIALDLQAALQA